MSLTVCLILYVMNGICLSFDLERLGKYFSLWPCVITCLLIVGLEVLSDQEIANFLTWLLQGVDASYVDFVLQLTVQELAAATTVISLFLSRHILVRDII